MQGLRIDLINDVFQTKLPREIKFSATEQDLVDIEIDKMLESGIIEDVTNDPLPDEYISNIFTRPKKPSGLRVILNLKNFNENVEYVHFKMQSLQTAVDLMSPGAFMASIDFKQAYYCLGVYEPHRKYLRFFYKGRKLQFSCLPNGLSSGPRVFTKLMKKLFRYLKMKGYLNTSFIDDSFLIGNTFLECYKNVVETALASTNAGFVVHPDKSIFIPSQILVYLGFILNTIDMTVRLTEQKKLEIKTLISSILEKSILTILEVAQLVGKLVATFPGVSYARLYYRQVEIEKINALKESKGNYKRNMTLSLEAKKDLAWWLANIDASYVDISIRNPDMELFCDASDSGWGGTIANQSTRGQWSEDETLEHINVKELLAVFLTLKSLCDGKRNIVLKVVSDNTTCVSYLNKQGGRKANCHKVSKDIWQWAILRNIWLVAVHLPGKENVEADKLSRVNHGSTEWSLSCHLFVKIQSRFGPLNFDLFASRLNNKLPLYASWKPDPGAKLCDSLSFDWASVKGYAFPPFALIGKVLRKVNHDKCSLVIVVPEWPSQHWFPMLLKMLVDFPVFIPSTDKGRLHNPKGEKPIKANMLVCKISGLVNDTQLFLHRQRRLLRLAGGIQHTNSMKSIYHGSKTFVIEDIPIPCQRI